MDLCSTKKDRVALLYSGGTDSTFASYQLSKSFNEVHLITYTRLGFFSKKLVFNHFNKICKRFPQTTFMHYFINVDRLYKDLCYENYFNGIKKYGFMALATCGFCKVSMHWRNLIYCIDNNIKYAADGATVEAKEYVEQNPRILMIDIKEMYSHFGVTVINPSYKEGLSTEKELYRLGIVENEKIKRTKLERQIYCTQHILYAMLLRIYLQKKSFSEFEESIKEYFKTKVNYIVDLTDEYIEKGKNSKLFKLIHCGRK